MKSPKSFNLSKAAPASLKATLHPSILKHPNFLTIQILLVLFGLQISQINKVRAEPNTSFQTYNISGQEIKLLTPETYCLLDQSNPADKMALTSLAKSLEGRNDVIAQFGNCNELKQWRDGNAQTFDHKGSYQVSSKLKSVDLTGKEQETVHNICSFLAAKGDPYSENIKHLEQGFKAIAPNQGKRLGIIHEDKNLCVAASVLRSEQLDDPSAGKTMLTPKVQISLYATSIIRGRLIYSYLYAPGKNIEDLNSLNKQIIQNHQLNQAANKTE